MIWQQLLKYPMLIVGIILFSLFLLDEHTQIWWKKYQGRYIPNTCTALSTRMNPKVPKSWQIECPDKDLLILNVKSDVNATGLKLRVGMYKELANTYVSFAKIANPETLAHLIKLKINLDHPKLKIESVSDGEAVVGFLKIKSQERIAQHLGATVKVKEIFK